MRLHDCFSFSSVLYTFQLEIKVGDMTTYNYVCTLRLTNELNIHIDNYKVSFDALTSEIFDTRKINHTYVVSAYVYL